MTMAEGSSGNEFENADVCSGHKQFRRKTISKKRLSVDKDGCRISRIDKLNEKIANLSSWLDDFSPSSQDLFTKNAVWDEQNNEDSENRLSHHEGFSTPSLKNLTHAENKKDIEKFAGVYSMKMVFSSNPNANQDSSLQHDKKSFSKTSKRPMLVELHSFPGFDDATPTPLPSPLTPTDILQVVTSAQLDLERKPTFKKEFKAFLFSDNSQAILLDTFWWFFCQKYQRSPISQELLFNRLAQNYTGLLIQRIGSRYENALFKRYPDLLAQSVYATFCQAFPTSYRQFNDAFKDELIFLTSQWITGTRPAPRTFNKWNFSKLEPKDMRKGDQLYLGASKKSKKQEFEAYLNERSSGLLNKTASGKLDVISSDGGARKTRKISKIAAKSTVSQENSQLPVIREAESKVNFLQNQKMIVSQTEQSLSKLLNDEGRERQGIAPTKAKFRFKIKKESCKAGRGPEFSKNAFDIYGISPLIDQYLRSNNLTADGGLGVLVRRTEIERLPSALSYDDIIKNVIRSSRLLKQQFNCLMEENESERKKLSKKRIQIQREMERATNELMSNPSLVKKISDILRLGLLRDQVDDDDISPADLDAEVAKALAT